MWRWYRLIKHYPDSIDKTPNTIGSKPFDMRDVFLKFFAKSASASLRIAINRLSNGT